MSIWYYKPCYSVLEFIMIEINCFYYIFTKTYLSFFTDSILYKKNIIRLNVWKVNQLNVII